MGNSPQEKMKHYGFAQVPRLVTRGKKYDLSLIEKGLYACLKDICGDQGECFYTLRNLAEEINTSISTLSRYIPKLRDAGLILAEKKPTAVNNHEIWHIRIVNIWEENDTLYHLKDCFTEKQSSGAESKIVSDRNNSVADRNKDCFYLNARVITNNQEEPMKNKGESIVPSNTPSSPVSSLPSAKLSLQAKCLLEQWDELVGSKQTRPKWVCDAAEELARIGATIEQITLIRDDLLKSPPKKGINLETIMNEWKRLPLLQRAQPSSQPTTGPLTMTDASRRNLERLKASTAQKG